MKYYTYTRGLTKSPEYTYFDSIEQLNQCYGIDSTEDDYNCGYSFTYYDKIYFLGCDEICDFE